MSLRSRRQRKSETTTRSQRISQSESISQDSPDLQKLIKHINRKAWWHVRPLDPRAYQKRGKFLSSSFSEAEFYGRPCDTPERVNVLHPIIGDDSTIETALIGRVESDPNMSIQKRLALDAKLRHAALRRGFDSIVLVTPNAFRKFLTNGTIPRSLELNVVRLSCIRTLSQA